MTRVLVAAASAVTRAGLEAIVARDPANALVTGAGTTASLADDVSEQEPDVVLVELGGGHEQHAIATLQLLSADYDDGTRPTPAFVLLTDERDPAHMIDALRAGVRALLPRDASAAEILAAVNAAAAGLVSVAREWTDLLRGTATATQGPGSAAPASNGASLTPRELEVLRMIADGLANKQIAARLSISEHTVKFHIGSVFAKMHASTRAEAVMIGARRGLIVL
ncbi:MAG: LuxR C-terminal-related transcriptional regulator [Gemmatimonadaceae bacterium]